MTDNPNDAPADNPGGDDKGGNQPGETFTQADVDRIVKERVQRERAKFADYDALKAKAGESATLEERVAAMEKRATKAEAAALRARFAADVPEKLRPLLTGSTEEELTAQRDLLIEAESERKKNGNHVAREGNTPSDQKKQSSWSGVLAKLDES